MRPIGLKNKDNITYLNGHVLKDIAVNYQTPLYILDETQLLKNINDYKTCFKSSMFKTSVVYASKALLTKEIVKIINEHDLYMDSVSLEDLYVAKESGFNMEHIVFHGNNKSIEELEYAVQNDIGILVVDNLVELKRLVEITNHFEKSIKIMIQYSS